MAAPDWPAINQRAQQRMALFDDLPRDLRDYVNRTGDLLGAMTLSLRRQMAEVLVEIPPEGERLVRKRRRSA